MPAQYKYAKGQTKRRYDSSSSSPRHNHRQKESKAYRAQKWSKRSRSRSRSNPKQDNKYKFTYHANRQDRRYNGHQYQYKRDDDYKKRDPSDERRDRKQEKKHTERFVYKRNDERERDRVDRQHRNEEKRQKSVENKRWKSPVSQKSSSPSPKHDKQDIKRSQAKPSFGKTQKEEERRQKKQFDQPKYKYIRNLQEDSKRQKKQALAKDKQSDKPKKTQMHIQKETQQIINPFKVKFPMRMPPPPPSRNYQDSDTRRIQRQPKREEIRKQNNQMRDEKNIKKEERQSKKDDIKSQTIRPKTILAINKYQIESDRISPIKRFPQLKKHIQDTVIQQAPKVISRFQQTLNLAKANLQVPTPPISFMALDAFKSMNKFQVQTLQPRWRNSLNNELQKVGDIKTMLQPLPKQEIAEPESRLWMYLKQERNEMEHDMKFRLEELRLHNTNLNELVRKLSFIDR